MTQYIIIFGLILIILMLLTWVLVIKHNIRNMEKKLQKTREENYNAQLRITLGDNNLEALAAEINRNLDYQKKVKLEEALSRKKLEQSISDIAHDLRTPLTVVKGNLQMLSMEPLSDKEREYVEIITRKTDTLKGMVDEFFELSVLESDSKPAELEKVDAIEFLSEFILENETVIRQADLTPDISFPEKSIFIQANAAMLSRVFSNIIGNILKYARDSFSLKVSEESENSWDSRDSGDKRCVIKIGNKVADPGAIDIEHIFDRTYRADKARSESGAGLGLYIAKLLVEKQGGTILAEITGGELIFTIKMNNAKL